MESRDAEKDAKLVAFQLETHGKHKPDCVPGRMARIAAHYLYEASRLKLENQRLREAAEQVAWEAESCARGAGEEGDKGNSRAYRALASLARKALQGASNED